METEAEGQKETEKDADKAEGKLTKQKGRWKRVVHKYMAKRIEKEGAEEEEEKGIEEEEKGEEEEEEKGENVIGCVVEHPETAMVLFSGEATEAPLIAEIESEEEEEKGENVIGCVVEHPETAMVLFSGEVTEAPLIAEIESEEEDTVEDKEEKEAKGEVTEKAAEAVGGNRDGENQKVEKQKVKKNVTKLRTPREKRRIEPSQFKKPPYTAEGKAKKKNKGGAEAEVGKKRERKDKPEGRITRQRTKK